MTVGVFAAVALALSMQAAEPTLAASGPEPCALPAKLREALQERFGSSRVLTASDLYEDERALFRAEHPRGCPGVAVGKFFTASERPAYAVVLKGVEPKKNLLLVIARPALKAWILFEADELDAGATPAVGRAKAAVDQGATPVRGGSRDAVTLTSYETWRRLYVWNGRAFERRQDGN